MSTIKTTYLQHPSAASPNLTLAADGSLTGGAGLGKVLQVVRATDGTSRTTTSTSYVDIPGMSVTITPQRSDSNIWLVFSFYCIISRSSAGNNGAYAKITDSAGVGISGAQQMLRRFASTTDIRDAIVLTAYATPATTSAVTYKLVGAVETGSTFYAANNESTAQMFAIEIAA